MYFVNAGIDGMTILNIAGGLGYNTPQPEDIRAMWQVISRVGVEYV